MSSPSWRRSAVAPLLAALLVLVGVAPAHATEGAPPVGVRVVAHRGAVDTAPEHTFPALDLAVAERADRQSVDVRLTSDGVPVVVHDATLSRTSDVAARFGDRATLPVESFTLAELRQLDAGSWYSSVFTGARVLTLDQVLAELAASPATLMLEVKSPDAHGGVDGIGAAVLAALDRSPGWLATLPDGEPRLQVEAFPGTGSPWHFLDELHARRPGLAITLLGTPTADDLTQHGYAREVDLPLASADAATVARVHAAGLQVGVWTVNTLADMERVLDAGADGVTTDEPQVLRDLLARRGATWSGTAWTPPATVGSWGLSVPASARTDARVQVSSRLLDAAGHPVRYARVRVESLSAGTWTAVGTTATRTDGKAALLVPADPGQPLRVASGGQASPVVDAPRLASTLAVHGPATLVDETTGTLEVDWGRTDGAGPVDAPLEVWSRVGTAAWRLLATTATVGGHASVPIGPRDDTDYQVRGAAGAWWKAPAPVGTSVDNLPPAAPVVAPVGAPSPSVTLTAQARPTSSGADVTVAALTSAQWRTMSSATWHTGCPVSRSGLRLVRASYWGFDGYRHRGSIVVSSRTSTQLARVLRRLYAERLPLRSLRRVEEQGTRSTAVSRTLRADATFGFTCEKVPGDSSSRGTHAWGTVVTVNAWENPTRVTTGGSPDTWWLRRPTSPVVHGSGRAVVAAFAAEGFSWRASAGRYGEFHDVRWASAHRRLDERRLGHPEDLGAATHVDGDLGALLDLPRQQGQADPGAAGGREGPGGDLPDRHVGGQGHPHVRARDATPGGDQPAEQPAGATLPLGQQHLAAPERGLGPADGPAEPGLVRRDVQADVLPVQGVAHLGAQGVAGTEAAGPDPRRLPGGEQRVPQGPGGLRGADQLVAALAGVAGAADDHGRARVLGLHERHVVVAGRQADGVEHLVRARALHGQHGVPGVLVEHLDPVGGARGQAAQHLGGVGGVRHQEHVLVVVQVGDEVVDHTTRRVVAAERVLRLAGRDAAEVVRQRRVDVRRRAGPAHDALAEVAHVEDADGLADRGVLLDDAAAGVLQRHRPATELRQLGAERDVPVVQRRGAQGGPVVRGGRHGGEPTAAGRSVHAG